MIYDLLIADVAHMSGITLEEFTSTSRRSDIVRARQVAWYLLYHHYGWSYPVIARKAGKNHATILHGCNHIMDLMVMHSDVKMMVEELKRINYYQMLRC